MATNYPYYSPYPAGQPFQPGNRPMYVEQPQPQIGIKGRPVSSIEEARAMSIDFDGSIFYFPDIANKRIYTKQINMDGTSTLNVYEFKDIPTEQVVSTSQCVTREEFETRLNQLEATLSSFKATLTEPKKEQKKDAPVMDF